MISQSRVFCARAWIAALALSCTGAFAQGTPPYAASFEPAEGHAPGPFEGYPEWTWIGGLSVSVATPGFDGAQRLELLGTGSLEWVAATAFGPGPVWLDLMVRPVPGAAADLPAAAPGRSALTGFVQVGATGEVYVFNGYGSASGAGTWRPSGARLTRAGDGSFIPLRLTYRVDYAARRWDLFVDGKLVWADLAFADATVPAFGRFSLRADSSVSTGFDFFYVGGASPLFADTSGDGIPDAWWLAHGLNPATAGGRHGDVDADGLSNLAEYLLGLDPADPDSNHNGVPDGIEALDANFRPVAVSAATLLSSPGDGLAWRASFSPTEGYAPGPLDGQLGWRGLHAEVTSDAEVRLGSASGPAEIERKFTPAALGGVWITFRARLQAGPLPEIQPARQPFAALFGFAGRRALTVRDGDAWIPHFVPANADAWNQYVLHLDYATGRWLLGFNGALVARDLAFNDASRRTLAAFRALQAGSGGEAWIDDLVITEREPAGLDFDLDGLDGRAEATLGTNPFLADTDGDGMPDGWEVARGFNPLNPADAAQDPDGDSLTNLVEYRLGTDPRSADDRVAGALVAQLWKALPGDDLSGLLAYSRFPLQPTESLLLEKISLPYNFGRDYGARIRGYLLPPADGDYVFWIAATDQASLWLSPTDSPFDRRRIAWVDTGVEEGIYDTLPTQRSAVIRLRAGQAFYFEVLQKGGVSFDHLNVAWRTPNGSREVIPAAHVASFARRADDLDDDGLPDAWETGHGLSAVQGSGLHGAYGDFDGDGLSNLEEYQLGTNPALADTDADGIGDYEAVRLLGIDPTAGLFTGAPATLVTLEGAAGFTVSGTWATREGGIEARSLRGTLGYDLALPAAGIYRFDLTVRDAAGDNPFRQFDLEVFVDGQPVGRLDIRASGAESGLGQLYLPWLAAGAHRLELVWNNGRPESFLRIDSLRLVNPGTLDADGDGVADWMQARLARSLSLDPETVQTDVSPFTLEGGSLYPQFLAATARYRQTGRSAERAFEALGLSTSDHPPQGQRLAQVFAEAAAAETEDPAPTVLTLPVEAGLERRFFTHVPLDPEGPVSVLLQEGAAPRVVAKKIVWKPLDLSALAPGASRVLRSFDRLLLTVREPAGAGADFFPAALRLVRPDASEETLALQAGDLLELGFDLPGDYQLWLKPGGEAERLVLALHVYAVELNPAPITFVNTVRDWSPALLPAAAAVQADPGLLLDEKLPARSPRAFALSAPLAGGSLVARLGGENGPIADVLHVRPLSGYASEKGKWPVLHVFEDGTELWQGYIDLGGPAPADIRVTLNIFKAGVTFLDGTLVKTLTAADFDAEGRYLYHMLRPPETHGSVCHTVKFYEGTTDLNYQY